MVRRFGSVWEACDGKGPFTLREILALHRQWEVFPGDVLRIPTTTTNTITRMAMVMATVMPMTKPMMVVAVILSSDGQGGENRQCRC